MIRELAKQHEGKSQETSGHVFELHTPVLELGLWGATHALGKRDGETKKFDRTFGDFVQLRK